MTGRTNAGGGVQLPALTNPAAAGNIQSGYQAINGEGEVVTGTAYISQLISGSIDVNASGTEIYVYYSNQNGAQRTPLRSLGATGIQMFSNSVLVLKESVRSKDDLCIVSGLDLRDTLIDEGSITSSYQRIFFSTSANFSIVEPQ